MMKELTREGIVIYRKVDTTMYEINVKQSDNAKEHGYANFRHYTDNGYSGGSFERPGWKRLIEDIEAVR